MNQEIQKTDRQEILVVDDTPASLQFLTRILSDQGYRVRPASSGSLALRSVAVKAPDLILLDVKMPGMDGYEVCRHLKSDEQSREIPVIFISALKETSDKVKGFNAGGIDYMSKPFQPEEVLVRVRTHLRLRELSERLEQKVRERTAELTAANQQLWQEITERKRAEEERDRLLAQIQEQARRVQQIVDTVPEGVSLLDAGGQVILANPLGKKDLITLAGAQVGETIEYLGGRPLAELLTSPPKGLWHDVATDEQDFQVIARLIENGPTSGGWVLVVRDVTQQREFERRIQQQERLAAVGQLAAGIAHDFNNIMATIVLYAQMTMRVEELPVRIRERMKTIDRQAQHATRLIRQILDFSRRSVLERQPLDIALLLKEQIKLLERILPENMEIELVCGPDEASALLLDTSLFIVNADSTRMQQMLTNLAVNARDAMLEGGSLRIKLERIRVAERKAAPLPEMRTGEWVQVTVSDTGIGISPDVLPHIFDPFFTTKGPGEGSGLGLAQVHGIVMQHEGHIAVESQVGQGTVFSIYLPALPVYAPETPTLTMLDLPRGRGETILVVEDNDAARNALVESLEQLNYRVIEAANGREALATLEQRGSGIALVLSDVVMPEMGGVALLHALMDREINVSVVLLTGHPLEKEMENLRAQGMADWLSKPPDLQELAGVIDRAIRAGEAKDES